MRKRTNRKSSASDLLATPPSPPPSPSPASFDFDAAFKPPSISSLPSKKMKKNDDVTRPTTTSLSPLKFVTSIADLNTLASSALDSIKRSVERSHSEILKDVESSNSRLHKRLKIQTQACQQATDEAEKGYKKMSERINESREAMKASYAELIAEAQGTASSVCKTSIPELSLTLKKAIDGLQSRYGIQSN